MSEQVEIRTLCGNFLGEWIVLGYRPAKTLNSCVLMCRTFVMEP